jgi:phosphoenolpyruvate-protein kinase (PTS system EI component)
MDEQVVVRGAAASPGLALGAARVLDAAGGRDGDVRLEAADSHVEQALAALESAAERLSSLAADAARAGHDAEAEILETSVMMARDPGLVAEVERQVREGGRSAAAALVAAAETQAELLASIDDPVLAARADDVRSIGRRAARVASGTRGEDEDGAGEPVVLIAEDLGPADVAELADGVCGVVLARGAVTAHAAIVARSRGLPMVVAAGDAALGAEPGAPVVVDGDAGELVLRPGESRLATARAAAGERDETLARARAERDLPAVTRDGRVVRVLSNVASAAEVRTALDAGAEGAGLIRTELPFLDAADWPTEAEHEHALAPVLSALHGRLATVRVLDFGGDKVPPFLRGTPERGLRLLLGEPAAFDAQLRAILRAAAGTELRLLLPMVDSHAELLAAQEAIARAVEAVPGAQPPAVGAMVETPRGADAAFALAAEADFLSIGTNDLTHSVLGSDRFHSAEAPTHDPRVLRAIHRCVRAARRERVVIEVCGEAASNPATLPLLVGLGVDEISVGAARVGTARAWVRELDDADCRDVATRALMAGTAAEVADLVGDVAVAGLA